MITNGHFVGLSSEIMREKRVHLTASILLVTKLESYVNKRGHSSIISYSTKCKSNLLVKRVSQEMGEVKGKKHIIIHFKQTHSDCKIFVLLLISFGVSVLLLISFGIFTEISFKYERLLWEISRIIHTNKQHKYSHNYTTFIQRLT